MRTDILATGVAAIIAGAFVVAGASGVGPAAAFDGDNRPDELGGQVLAGGVVVHGAGESLNPRLDLPVVNPSGEGVTRQGGPGQADDDQAQDHPPARQPGKIM